MPAPARRKEVGRGERVLPGVWRLRLPLSFPGVPHVNAWALSAGDGIVLVDCGINEPGSRGHLERAMHQVGLSLEHVRMLVCTHAHTDHCGQAADIVEVSGCELWVHPNHAHFTRTADDPERALERRLEIASHSGVPPGPLRRYAEQARSRVADYPRLPPPDHDLVEGVEIVTDLGRWRVYETPGHAPSHVCLHQPERRLLISGDHLLGRVSPYYDVGYTPDPVGEFLASLDTVDALDARLCLSGHGRTFADVHAHVNANRELVAERLAALQRVLEREPTTPYDALPGVFGADFRREWTARYLTETLGYLRHMEVTGWATRDDGNPERWSSV